VVAFQCKHNGLHAREGMLAVGQREWPPDSGTEGDDYISGTTKSRGKIGEQ